MEPVAVRSALDTLGDEESGSAMRSPCASSQSPVHLQLPFPDRFLGRREGCPAMLPVVPPFLIGLIAAPLLKRLGKPVMRGIVKTSVGLGLEVKRAVHEAGQGIQDLAAEATAEVLAAQLAHRAEPGTDISAPTS